MPQQRVPFYSLGPQHEQIHNEAVRSLTSTFQGNWYILGEELLNFEKEYAGFHGMNYCVGVGNGYDALFLAIRACALGSGDEIIVPANTYIATWLAISNSGCKIVPVEPDALTKTIDVQMIERQVTHRTRAIMPVHLYGYPCDMTAILDIAHRHNLVVIEDNAQSHGATWNGQMTGSFGAINATSFYPTKNLGALGDGGAITTNDATLAEKVRQLRNYGFSQKNVCDEPGMNSRLDELQAAILRIKLRYLQHWNEQRKHAAVQYLELLQGVGDLGLPFSYGPAGHVYHLFVITTAERERLIAHLSKAGIDTQIHYPRPPHLQKAYDHLGFRKGAFPVSEQLAGTCLSLPLWPGMSSAQMEYVAEAVRKFYL
jgi:dTDP-4-amino-4,6-dideoxygalactose transaminase